MERGHEWDAVPPGSVLTVKLTLSKKTVVAGTIIVERPDGSQRARINAGHFRSPLKVSIAAGATHEVKFAVMHTGETVKYAIDARLAGPDGKLFGEAVSCADELTADRPVFTMKLVANAAS